MQKRYIHVHKGNIHTQRDLFPPLFSRSRSHFSWWVLWHKRDISTCKRDIFKCKEISRSRSHGRETVVYSSPCRLTFKRDIFLYKRDLYICKRDIFIYKKFPLVGPCLFKLEVKDRQRGIFLNWQSETSSDHPSWQQITEQRTVTSSVLGLEVMVIVGLDRQSRRIV